MSLDKDFAATLKSIADDEAKAATSEGSAKKFIASMMDKAALFAAKCIVDGKPTEEFTKFAESKEIKISGKSKNPYVFVAQLLFYPDPKTRKDKDGKVLPVVSTTCGSRGTVLLMAAQEKKTPSEVMGNEGIAGAVKKFRDNPANVAKREKAKVEKQAEGAKVLSSLPTSAMPTTSDKRGFVSMLAFVGDDGLVRFVNYGDDSHTKSLEAFIASGALKQSKKDAAAKAKAEAKAKKDAEKAASKGKATGKIKVPKGKLGWLLHLCSGIDLTGGSVHIQISGDKAIVVSSKNDASSNRVDASVTVPANIFTAGEEYFITSDIHKKLATLAKDFKSAKIEDYTVTGSNTTITITADKDAIAKYEGDKVVASKAAIEKADKEGKKKPKAWTRLVTDDCFKVSGNKATYTFKVGVAHKFAFGGAGTKLLEVALTPEIAEWISKTFNPDKEKETDLYELMNLETVCIKFSREGIKLINGGVVVALLPMELNTDDRIIKLLPKELPNTLSLLKSMVVSPEATASIALYAGMLSLKIAAGADTASVQLTATDGKGRDTPEGRMLA